MLDQALCHVNTAKWHLDQSWLKARKKGVLSAPSYLYVVIYTGIFPGSLSQMHTGNAKYTTEICW